MIVLKNLARDYNIDPRYLRQLLRKQFNTVEGGRWQWENEKDATLKKIRTYISSLSQSSKPKTIASSSQKATRPKRSRSTKRVGS